MTNGEESQQQQEQPAPPPEPAKEEQKPQFSAGDSLLDVAKKLLFIADDAGEPEVVQGTDHSVVLQYPDNSLVTIRFEARAGQWNSVGAAALDEEQKKARNEKVSELKKAADERKAAYAEAQAAKAKPVEATTQ